MKILTVDDHAESLFLLGALLRGHGHEVDTASDGHEALKLAESGAYDAVISDILMPRMDGFQFCRELREYLKSNKPEYITSVQTEKQLSEASEALLKAAINEVKSSMLAAA